MEAESPSALPLKEEDAFSRTETKQDFIKALDKLLDISKSLNEQVDQMGEIMQANAIAEAKQEAEQLRTQFHCPYDLMVKYPIKGGMDVPSLTELGLN